MTMRLESVPVVGAGRRRAAEVTACGWYDAASPR